MVLEVILMRTKLLGITYLALLISCTAIVLMSDLDMFPITGEVTTTVNIMNTTILTCDKSLSAGWHMFSMPCIGTQENASQIFGTMPGLFSAFEYNPNDPEDPWKSYAKGIPSWVIHDIGAVSKKKGYWIRMLSPGEFSYEGRMSDSTSMSLVEGWNLIGYPSDNVSDVVVVFDPVSDVLSIVQTYNSTLAQTHYYVPGGINNTLNNTYPFQGYWVNISAARTLTITR